MENLHFTRNLLAWHDTLNKRSMPWKNERDPYRIWLSEIILQQTRVAQGIAYYERFVAAFPDIVSLAQATENKVFKLWEGLGYYSRCRNLIATARIVADQYGGRFPDRYEDILALKGVGAYTAAAIASFAFGHPHAVVDGNVQRVLARFFGMAAPVDGSREKHLYNRLADALLDRDRPAAYNQAIMDFGATVCTPRQPACADCALREDCVAYEGGWVEQLPPRRKAAARRTRWLYYFLVELPSGRKFVRKRPSGDIWENLYEFVLWESAEPVAAQELIASPFLKKIFGRKKFAIAGWSAIYRHALTHQQIEGVFVHVRAFDEDLTIDGYEALSAGAISALAFPRFITLHLAQPSLVSFSH